MKLTVTPRMGKKKSELTQIRRAGDIPAVVYVRGGEGQTVSISGTEFAQVLRTITPGRLSTTVFEITIGEKPIKAIVKDIQYNVTSYEPIHLDFFELKDDAQVTVKVPIHFTGTVECVGVKLGGVVRQVIRHVKVRCKKENLPSHFDLDVRELALKQSKRLSQIQFPEGVTPVSDLNQVAVAIVKR